jgi:hypothetical protein
MFTRELNPNEWPTFFDAFSREYQGHRVTLDLPEPHTLGTIEAIARDVPFLGITAEPRGGGTGMRSIEIVLGTTPQDHLVHTVNLPTRVFVARDEHGADEVIVIRSQRDPTVRLDFHEPSARQRAVPGPVRAAAES